VEIEGGRRPQAATAGPANDVCVNRILRPTSFLPVQVPRILTPVAASREEEVGSAFARSPAAALDEVRFAGRSPIDPYSAEDLGLFCAECDVCPNLIPIIGPGLPDNWLPDVVGYEWPPSPGPEPPEF